MRKVLIDEQMLAKFNGLKEVVELCDESGKIVAQIIPIPAAVDPNEWEYTEPPPLTEEELRRIEQEPDYSYEEVMEYLQKL